MEEIQNRGTETKLTLMPVFIRLAIIPLVLLPSYLLLPGLIGLLVPLILALLFKHGGLLTKSGTTLVVSGIFILPVYQIISQNYITYMMLSCLLFSLPGGLSLAAFRGKKPWNIRIFSIVTASFFMLTGGSFYLSRFQWFPYPSLCERTLVKSYDYKIMHKFFGKNPPESFKISQVYFQPHLFPAPDGPFPVQYVVQITAADYQKLVTGIQLDIPKDDDERDFYLRRMFSSEKFHNDLPDEYYKSFDDNSHYRPPTIYLKSNAGWFYLDERTSPSLRLYISTRLPYQAER